MARKLTGDEAILINAVLRQGEGREIEGGKLVQVQFASDCGKVIATVSGTVISFSPPDLEAHPTLRNVQIVVSKETLRSVSQHFEVPVAHLPQACSAFLTSEAVVLGTVQQQLPEPLPLSPGNRPAKRGDQIQ